VCNMGDLVQNCINIIFFFAGYNADIICLQEVDSKVFSNDLIPILSSVGFNGIFHKKGGTVSEGLACIFHESRFK